jgi:hypothetical protein
MTVDTSPAIKHRRLSHKTLLTLPFSRRSVHEVTAGIGALRGVTVHL